MLNLVFASLLSLSFGVMTGMTPVALSHIFILIPALYYGPKTDWKNLRKSEWMLLLFCGLLICSVLFNQSVAVNGYKPIFKIKYFLLAFFSILPIREWFKTAATDKKLSWLLYGIIGTTTIVGISGMIALKFHYNPLLLKHVEIDRNPGVFGMVMNYAHNLSYLLLMMVGLYIYRDEAKRWININFLLIAIIINLLAFYTSYTRGAWLAFICALPFYFFKNHLKKFILISSAGLILGGAAYFMASQNVIRPGSDRQRISQWQTAVAAFYDRPLLGYGYLNFELACPAIKKNHNIGSQEFCGHAHNNQLEILASAGILGFVAFLLWQFFWFVEVFRSSSLVSRIALPILVAIFVGGLTQATISLGANLFLIMGFYTLTKIEKPL